MARFYHGFEAGVWYEQEATEGTTDTNATFLHLAHKTDVRISDQPNPVVVAKSGSVDNADIDQGVENPIITFTFNPSQASGAAFMKNFSSTDNSFSLLIMTDEASDIIFGRITGCKVKRISTRVQLYPSHGAVECTVEVWGWAIAYAASAGSPTFEAAPQTFLNWSDVTVKKNTVTVTDWWDFEYTIENDLFRIRNNLGVTTGIEKGRRSITGSWTHGAGVTAGVGNTELDEAKNATDVDLQIGWLSDTYDFVNAAYSEVGVTHPITEMVGIKSDFVAESLLIA